MNCQVKKLGWCSHCGDAEKCNEFQIKDRLSRLVMRMERTNGIKAFFIGFMVAAVTVGAIAFWSVQ